MVELQKWVHKLCLIQYVWMGTGRKIEEKARPRSRNLVQFLKKKLWTQAGGCHFKFYKLLLSLSPALDEREKIAFAQKKKVSWSRFLPFCSWKYKSFCKICAVVETFIYRGGTFFPFHNESKFCCLMANTDMKRWREILCLFNLLGILLNTTTIYKEAVT